MIWTFRDFELDDVRFELRRGGKRVRLAPKPLALLLHLAKRHPASVSREELFRILWPGVRVTRASLARAVLAARHALGEEGNREGLIRTIRGRGYALADVLTSESSPETVAPFVGRAAELARIEAALDNVEVGRGRVLLISGEPGIGKSRLLEELAARARARGTVVVSGQCREEEGTPPYWPWSEILRSLMVASDDSRLRSFVEPLLAGLTPHHIAKAGEGRGRMGLTDADARFRLFQNVADALRQGGRGRPLVVLIEDLHWAGPGALHLMRFAGRSLANASVLMATTYRDSGPPPNPLLEATTGELGTLPHAVPELRLPAFRAAEIAAYVRQVTGQPAEANLVRRLQEAAGGNPLFLRELVPIFVGRGGAGEPRELNAVPASINHIVRAQVARLCAPARTLIQIASVSGRDFDPQVLARASGHRLDRVLDHLAEACAQNLIHWEQPGRFRFRHDIIRTALLESLRPKRRIELHERVAKAIEAAAHPGDQLAKLASHYFEAVPRIGPEKAIQYCTQAAEIARRALDFDGSAHHYRQALAALEWQRVSRPTERCDLLIGLGEVLERAGHLTEAREAILEAAALARELHSFPRLGHAALAIAAWQQAAFTDSVAVQLVEDALRAVGRRPIALRARLLAKLAVWRQLEGSPTIASGLLEEALALAKRLDDASLHCDVLVQKLLAQELGTPEDLHPRLAFTEKLLRVAKRAENPYAILQCRRQRIALLLGIGAGAELDEEIELFARDTAATGCKQYYVTAFRAMRAVVSGRFEEARQAIDEAESLADPISFEEHRINPILQRFNLPPEFRDSEALERAIREVIREIPELEEWRVPHALVALDLGSLETARAALRWATADDFAYLHARRGLHTQNYAVNFAALTDISWRLGETRYADRLYDFLLPHADTQATTGLGMIYMGPVDWYLGVLATMLGRRRDAGRFFQGALASTERLGARPWHARTELTYARLLATGSAFERRRARALAASAADCAKRLGMDSLRRAAKQSIVKLGRADRAGR